MRDYLYVWNDPVAHCLIASGVEFCDLVPLLATTGGIVLLRHKYTEADFEPFTRFEYVPSQALSQLVNRDLFSYGDLCWVDFETTAHLHTLDDEAIADLAFFGQVFRPRRAIDIPGLGNRGLWHLHDDGWYLRVLYRDWEDVAKCLQPLMAQFSTPPEVTDSITHLKQTSMALWCQHQSIRECEMTDDIDRLQISYYQQ